MNDHPESDHAALGALLRQAEDCAGFAMRKIGQVPPTRTLLDAVGLTEAVLRGGSLNN